MEAILEWHPTTESLVDMKKLTKWEKLMERRRVLVDRPFQLDFIYRVACYSVFVMAVLAGGLLFPVLKDLHTDGPWANESATAMLYVHEHIWPIAILLPVLCVLWSLWLSHRIAGPMVRIKRCMSTLSTGVIPEPVTLRPGDYMQSEVEQLNQMLESLSERALEVGAAETVLQQSIHICVDLARTSEDRVLRDALAKLSEDARALHAKLPVTNSDGAASEVCMSAEAASAAEAEFATK